MNKIHVGCMFLLFLMVLGCQSTTEVIKIPQWVSTPPLDTQDLFYGIGSGPDVKTANNAALKDVASKLGVTVEGVYAQRQQVNNSIFQNDIDDRVQLSVEKTFISKYQIVANEVAAQLIYSLVRVSKTQLVMDAQKNLSEVNALASNLIKYENNKNNFIWTLETEQFLKDKKPVAYRYATIVQMLNSSENINEDLSIWALLDEKVSLNQKKLCVTFKNIKQSSAEVISVIKSSLSKQRIKISDDCTHIFKMSSKHDKKVRHKKYVYTYITNFEFSGEGRIILASKNISFTGTSSSSFIGARKDATEQLDKKLREETIWQLLDIVKTEKKPIM